MSDEEDKVVRLGVQNDRAVQANEEFVPSQEMIDAAQDFADRVKKGFYSGFSIAATAPSGRPATWWFCDSSFSRWSLGTAINMLWMRATADVAGIPKEDPDED